MAAEEGVLVACHTKEEFDSQMNKAKEAGKLVVIDFTASWCGPCRFIAPVFVEFAKKYTGAVFLKVDVDELKEVAAEYEVEAMPTFLFIKNGNKVDTVVGARKEELQAKVEQHHAVGTRSKEEPEAPVQNSKIGLSGFANRMVRFRRDRRQSGASPALDEGILLRPRDVWTVERQEPQQSKGLWRRLQDLIKEKNEK